MKAGYCIYALCEPDQPDEIRYVGRTGWNPQIRLDMHYHACTQRKGPLYDWLIALRDQQWKRPTATVIEEGIQNLMVAEELERQWIAVYYAMGARLLNRNCLFYDGHYAHLLHN